MLSAHGWRGHVVAHQTKSCSSVAPGVAGGPVHAEIKAAAKHPHESATNTVATSQLKSSRSSKDPGLFYDAKSHTSKLG